MLIRLWFEFVKLCSYDPGYDSDSLFFGLMIGMWIGFGASKNWRFGFFIVIVIFCFIRFEFVIRFLDLRNHWLELVIRVTKKQTTDSNSWFVRIIPNHRITFFANYIIFWSLDNSKIYYVMKGYQYSSWITTIFLE